MEIITKDIEIPVLVTGVGGGSTGEGIIKTLGISKTPYRIVAVDALPISFGFFDADSYCQVPPAGADDYLNKIFDICQKEKIKVIIPGSEPELKKMSDNRQLFKEKNILLLINNKEVIDLCMDKWKTYNFLKDNGFLCPDCVLAEKEEEIADAFLAFENKLPVIIKPVKQGGASVNTFIAQDKEEFIFFTHYLFKQGLQPLIQQYVGSPSEEYTVGVLSTFKGEFLGSIALKRQILSGLSSKLKIKDRRPETKNNILAVSSGYSQGTIDDYKDIRECAEKIAQKINSTGPINIQGRNTEKGFYVFEINPRLSGTSIMRAMVGFNEIDTLIRRELYGEKVVSPIPFNKGIVPRGTREKYIPFDQLKNISL